MMEGREFKQIRRALGLSVDQFAIELGYGGSQGGNRKTINRLERGLRDIPYSVAKLAWLLAQLPSLPEWPDHLVPVQLVDEDEIQ